ncbi:uncharacterized protein LOC118103586 [Hippoglossus stenolepis]|uniref:uncharacterized protein LOC118103586 n=1 Tax=Hippoglossus stenolepis TaxID=195615 RepID=UPI001FAEA4FC|nr:uncharacterized protein LOC118103586 [Hippoglossus stenolepis]
MMSHAINVSVHGGGEHTRKNNTIPKTCNPEALEPMWMYMSSAARIVGFVTVAVVMLCSYQCDGAKGNQRKGHKVNVSALPSPWSRGPSHVAAPPPGPRAIPSAPPSRLSAPKDPRPNITKVEQGEGRQQEKEERGGGGAPEVGGLFGICSYSCGVNTQQPQVMWGNVSPDVC